MTRELPDLAEVIEFAYAATSDSQPSLDGNRQLELLVQRRWPLLSGGEVDQVVSRVMSRRAGFGVLQRWLDDPDVNEVMINAGRDVWIERSGKLSRVGHTTAVETMRVLERVVAPLGLRIDRSSPMTEARLPGGARVHGVIAPVAVDGPCMTVRKFSPTRVPLSEFAEPAVVGLLDRAMRERRNIVVSGGTGSGKTTLLNALSSGISGDERVITIEEAAELSLSCAHVVRLETRSATAEGLGALTTRDLVRGALRMRPDRIVVGEVRGPEALDMIQAMNTGHSGSLTTVHANTGFDALRRIETLALYGDANIPLAALRQQLGAAVDVVVHVERRIDGRRTITGVGEVALDGRDVVPIDPYSGPSPWRRPARWAV